MKIVGPMVEYGYSYLIPILEIHLGPHVLPVITIYFFNRLLLYYAFWYRINKFSENPI